MSDEEIASLIIELSRLNEVLKSDFEARNLDGMSHPPVGDRDVGCGLVTPPGALLGYEATYHINRLTRCCRGNGVDLPVP